MKVLCTSLVLQFLFCQFVFCSKYEYTTYSFKQKVDHFSFSNHDTFSQRYLVSDKHWDRKSGPIFFYTGNEGDITLFAENSGFMWDIAPEFKAMLVFAEHRYYGKSMPYGKKSFLNTSYSGYLTSEQALADYVDLLSFIKTSVDGTSQSPVVAFGGSYGGMLAAWIRMKYPHVVDGSIAASAPILQFVGMTPCDKFSRVVTRNFAKESDNCAEVIRKSWSLINRKASTPSGSKWLTKNWKLCTPLNSTDDLRALKDYLNNVWTNLAMVNYPYPTTFLAPLPGYPVKVVCDQMKHPHLSDEEVLLQVFTGLSVYFNFTGGAKCLDFSQASTSQLGESGWNFQACTEMVMPFCSDGEKDFFEPVPWNFTDYSNNCYKEWRVMPRPLMAKNQYGGRDIHAASNIVFSNGLLDPWSTGGVLKNISSTLISILIPEGAHHLDLRKSDPNDPESVISARNVERYWIKKWVQEVRDRYKSLEPVA